MFVKDLLSFSILPICIFDYFQFGFQVQIFGCDYNVAGHCLPFTFHTEYYFYFRQS